MANLLAIDIGNTSVSYGIVKNGRVVHHFYSKIDDIPKVSPLFYKSGFRFDTYKVVVTSVNPKMTRKLKSWLAGEISPKNLLIIGRDLHPKFEHKYTTFSRLGTDRQVNIYGGIHRFKLPLLIVNFGTATTVDFISKKGVYEGGLIIPGIETSWNALQDKAALLPKIGEIGDFKPLLGKNTKNGMTAGILQGFGSMVDGLIDRFQAKYGKRMTVLTSGGLARKIRPYIKHKVKVDQTHTLKSLALVYKTYGEKNGV